jgi:PEP-CTERM motif
MTNQALAAFPQTRRVARAVALAALCLTFLLLASPLAHASAFSALAAAGPPSTGTDCAFGGVSAGGSGFTSASVGPVSCVFVNTAVGGSIGSVTGASGSWVTGDFSASALATGNPGNQGRGNGITATGMLTFSDSGLVTLPPGMDSAAITFGVTGISASAGGGPAVAVGGIASGDIVTLAMSTGGSRGTSGTSSACLMDQLVSSECPNGGLGFGLAAGALAPVTLTVHNGDDLQLSLSIESSATVEAYISPMSANAAIAIDPLYLTLPDGVTFDSGIADFLSGAPVSPVPEPASLSLMAAGLGAMIALRRRKRESYQSATTICPSVR